MRRLVASSLLALFVLAGCSSSSSNTTGSASVGSATASGTVKGVSLNGVSALAYYTPDIESATTSSPDAGTVTTKIGGYTILIADKADSCSTFHTQSTAVLTLSLLGAQATTGTFDVAQQDSPPVGVDAGSQLNGFADFNQLDATCANAVSETVTTTGTVTVTSVTTSSIQGTFNLTFPDGTITGTFNAPICGSAPDVTTSDGGLLCTP